MNFTKTFRVFCAHWNLNIVKIEELMLRGMKPGKILKREIILNYPQTVDKSDIAWIDCCVQTGLHNLHADQYATEILYARSYEQILEVYNDPNCPSCMMGGERSKIAAAFYAANGFTVAYRHDGEKVTARTVTLGDKCSDFYGPESMKLSAGLAELGYTPSEVSVLPFWSAFEVPYINGRYYLPYLDCASGCFLPYANRYDAENHTATCLYVPYSIEYQELIDQEELPEFEKLLEFIEHGEFHDTLLMGMLHGDPCKTRSAVKHFANRVANKEFDEELDSEEFNSEKN